MQSEQHNHSEERLLVLMCRYPEPGKVKTRLIPGVGPERACFLYQLLTEAALNTLLEVPSCDLVMAYTGGSLNSFRNLFHEISNYYSQPSGNLGQKMKAAFSDHFSKGYPKILLVGSDIPGLTVEIIREAFNSLNGHDVVLGPAEDGGYYLVGLSHAEPFLFDSVDWGTGKVLQQTLDRCAEIDLSVYKLKPLKDIDQPSDLVILKNDPRFRPFFESSE